MNISVEFTLTAADLRESMRAFGSRRFSLIRILAAVLVLFFGYQRLSHVGLDWNFALYLVFAVYLASTHFIFVWLFVTFWRIWASRELTSRVSIDEQTILIEQSKSRREIPWSSFAMTGTAREIENHFLLECGRGGVWIPKRAFSTADDLTRFRALVKEKMGERCQFNQ